MRGEKTMICPKCGSENISVQMVSETQLKKKHGCLYWTCIGWWLEPILWIFFTIPKLFYQIFKPKKHKLKTIHKSMCVCQNCGNHWETK